MEHDIPYALIGAFAMSLYGLPKFTADIDLLTEWRFRAPIFSIMERLGYTCFQKTKSFAQFDSELGVLGKIDFMFVSTADGRGILDKSVIVNDELLGNHPVIQPTDFIILKLMAIANNPERTSKDEGDILDILKVYEKGLIHEAFDKLDKAKIFYFAERFGQKQRADSLIEKIFGDRSRPGTFEL
jgi:hypothetical protein